METFSSSDFMCSPSGMLKIIGGALLIIGSPIFLALDECRDAPSWYDTFFPIITVASGILVIILYASFASGVVKRALNTWIVSDMIVSAVLFILSLAVSIVTLASCNGDKGSGGYIPEILGIIGAASLAASTAIIFYKWRSERDEMGDHEIVEAIPATIDPQLFRKSVLV